MSLYWVMGLNFFGTKAIIAYILVILIVVAIAFYARRGTAAR